MQKLLEKVVLFDKAGSAASGSAKQEGWAAAAAAKRCDNVYQQHSVRTVYSKSSSHTNVEPSCLFYIWICIFKSTLFVKLLIKHRQLYTCQQRYLTQIDVLFMDMYLRTHKLSFASYTSVDQQILDHASTTYYFIDERRTRADARARGKAQPERGYPLGAVSNKRKKHWLRNGRENLQAYDSSG